MTGSQFEKNLKWDQALNYYSIAANIDSKEAVQRIIDLCLSLGERFTEQDDIDKAIDYYQMAAEYDSIEGKYYFSTLCIKMGKKFDKEKCWAKSVDYFCKAAKFGDCIVISKIARYYDSCGRNDISVNWYKLAAKRGDSTSQKVLERLGISW